MKQTNKPKKDWEKEFEKFNKQWEGEGYLSMKELKSFIRSLLEQARQEGIEETIGKLKKEIDKEMIGKDDFIETPDRSINHLANLVNRARNHLRAEQRAKISELICRYRQISINARI